MKYTMLSTYSKMNYRNYTPNEIFNDENNTHEITSN